MVLIPPFVVEPGRRISPNLLLSRIGTAVSLVIADSRLKFCPGIFGQIVEQPLSVKPYLEAALHDQQPVVGDGPEMVPGVIFYFVLKIQSFFHHCKIPSYFLNNRKIIHIILFDIPDRLCYCEHSRRGLQGLIAEVSYERYS